MALLDETDIEILHSLQKDAKINAKELSEKLHISKTPIYERIKRLENEGYIKGYVALVDNKKIGLPLIIFCNVSLAVHDDEHIERFKEEIRNIDEIMECYSTGGIYDFFVKVVLKDLDAYNQFVFEKLTKVHGIVKIARHIGTFDTSILPYEDCCTVFTPRHPKTKPSVEETREYESALDVEGLCQRAMAGREMIRIKPTI